MDSAADRKSSSAEVPLVLESESMQGQLDSGGELSEVDREAVFLKTVEDFSNACLILAFFDKDSAERWNNMLDGLIGLADDYKKLDIDGFYQVIFLISGWTTTIKNFMDLNINLLINALNSMFLDLNIAINFDLEGIIKQKHLSCKINSKNGEFNFCFDVPTTFSVMLATITNVFRTKMAVKAVLNK